MFVVATDTAEEFLFLNHSCRSFTSKFSYKEFNFGPEHNTTFYVYVYNFQTPFTLQVEGECLMTQSAFYACT